MSRDLCSWTRGSGCQRDATFYVERPMTPRMLEYLGLTRDPHTHYVRWSACDEHAQQYALEPDTTVRPMETEA